MQIEKHAQREAISPDELTRDSRLDSTLEIFDFWHFLTLFIDPPISAVKLNRYLWNMHLIGRAVTRYGRENEKDLLVRLDDLVQEILFSSK